MRIISAILFCIIYINSAAQTEYQQFLNNLNSVTGSANKSAIVDSFMNYARSKGIPYIEGDTATFLYRGTTAVYNDKEYNLSSVFMSGDINYGGEFSLELKRIKDTDLYALRYYLEQNARLDYNYVLNGLVMITDPENPSTLPWGRIGLVNEIAMPGYEQPEEIIYNPDIPHGSGETFNLVNNENSTQTIHQIIVHLPAEYDPDSAERYPVAYFHDGSFYYYTGNADNILDNLIEEKKIKPIIGVFVNYSAGNRTKEYVFETERFIDFFNNQLVPYIDSHYKTIPDGDNRAVIGLSFGGNISSLIVNSKQGMYKNCGLHSGAIWPNNFTAAKKIYENNFGIKYYLVWGTYEPKLMNVGRMVRDSLNEIGYTNFKWGEYPQGHSMGFWRGTTDIFLEYFFPGDNITSLSNQKNKVLKNNFNIEQNFPNPFNPETQISYTINKQGFVKIVIYDILGREVKILVNGIKNPGAYSEVFDASYLPSGNYFYSMQFGGKFVTKKMSFIK